jgi:subtilisin family serine protease
VILRNKKDILMKKTILSALTFFALTSQAQDLKTKPHWHNLDYEKDGIRGMSVEKAYELLKGKTAKTVVVAVIDGGVDTQHEDLKDIIWTNPKEIAGNGIDDDKNGFVDDINGWDFIGGKDGQDIKGEQIELTRLLKKLRTKFGEKPSKRMIRKNKAEYELMQQLEKEYTEKVDESKQNLPFYKQLYSTLSEAEKTIKDFLKVETLTKSAVQNLEDASADRKIRAAKTVLMRAYEMGITPDDVKEGVEHFEEELNFNLNLDLEERKKVGDNPDKLEYGAYGNNEVKGPDATHGTHVSGIVAAIRTNGIGAMGVADNVRIMAIRAVPNGDERDKDVANAIRYAADNGAAIINMSFGKKYSPEKKWVDEAVKYALSKGVLLIHAAGNDAQDVDVEPNYISKKYESGGEADNWLTVGAISWKPASETVADFSNYGKTSVDVFAPGVDVYSTYPDGKYKEQQGTSMAAPAVTGVAALLKAYFPELTAAQLKKIIMDSTEKLMDLQVMKPGTKDMVSFGSLSVTGGVVNAYNAVKMALGMK